MKTTFVLIFSILAVGFIWSQKNENTEKSYVTLKSEYINNLNGKVLSKVKSEQELKLIISVTNSSIKELVLYNTSDNLALFEYASKDDKINCSIKDQNKRIAIFKITPNGADVRIFYAK
ncbi:hypothetical protein [Plebeiibacterium sediminum]|uniref:Uncharacterized protein n=1 Tax=Plebeiibacterium sediminum TaxID=2992112 RepID=A0AAE3M9X2_9BACT|nr:hypothetical protein [Plebeiobacterium sediminum]MCW3789642.1 hypothetical protein [Plebeiobacterium sediminum]